MLSRELTRITDEPDYDGSLKTKPPVFRGSGLEIQTYRGAEWVIAGPAETGKTWAAVWLLDSLLRQTPKAQGVLARKMLASIWGTVLVTYKRIQDLRVALGDDPVDAYGGEKPEWYTYSNGARLWVGGLDNPNKILSGERDFIYINQAEELKLGDWEILLTRCTGRGAVTKTPMLFGDCNPAAEDHWIIKRAGLQVFPSFHKDNPSLFDDEGNLTEQGERTMSRLSTLTGVRKARLYEGKWVGVEGLYFEVWDDEKHTCERFKIPDDWPIWGALDYGFSHPTAFGLFTQDDDGVIYLIGEHVQHKWLPPQHCRAIRRLCQRLGIDIERLRHIYAGHDIFQVRGDSRGKTISQQYREAMDIETNDPIGLKMQHANVARIPGAALLLELLGNPTLGMAPKIQFFKDCPRTINTMQRMVVDKDDPEDVLKVDADNDGQGGDDCYDMLRYGTLSRNRRVLRAA